jgi:integrase
MTERRHDRKGWSYSAGRRGHNRVRAYQDARDGAYYLEWSETVLHDMTGEPVMVRGKGGKLHPKKKRERALLKGVVTAVPRRIARTSWRRSSPPSRRAGGPSSLPIGSAPASGGQGMLLSRLIDLYLEVETPNKGTSKQDHDRRAGRIFRRLYGSRPAESLGRLEWSDFIAPSPGEIPGFGPVKDRQVAYDLKFLIAALNWGVGCGLIPVNPWSPERRRGGGMRMPKESRPLRRSMSDEVRERLIEHSPNWRFELALRLGRETVSRNSSVRHLRWSDVDLVQGTIRWRSEFDKNSEEVVVPLTPAALAALRAAPRGIGEAWVFPSERNPARPTSRHSFQIWLRRAKAALLKGEKDDAHRARLREALTGGGLSQREAGGGAGPEFPQAAAEAAGGDRPDEPRDAAGGLRPRGAGRAA